jgi:NAD(P)-dependent dehydrogenase (short-subunit alcohol dehydrogenase family)
MDTPVTIITGAGSGIGAATARALAARGHACVLVGRGAEKLEGVRRSLVEPTRHLVMPADVADSGLCDEIVDRTIEAYGRIDALVLAAGTAPKLPIERTSESTLEECFLVNTFGSAHFVIRAWPHFKARRAGRIVFVSTLGTLDPFPGFFAYAASKAAVDSFARSIRAEGKAIGVKAFAVNPGCVDTEILRRNFPEHVIPRDKTLPPEAIADVIVACVSGERDSENGGVIAVPSP